MSKNKISFNVAEEKSARLAVLIDADNASAQTIDAILEETTKFGEAMVKRIYGNFVGDNGKWKAVINEHAIKPMQQFAYTTGKNATDGFMIIDAMDLLYTGRFDGFCLVSSDSDFTALAIRLKEQGVTVYGFGKKQTPEAFRNACSQFIYVENLMPEPAQKETVTDKPQKPAEKQIQTASPENAQAQPKIAEQFEHKLPLETIHKIFEHADSEWMAMTAFGATWKRLQVKKYSDVFDYEMRKTAEGTQEHMYVKLKV